MGRFGQALGQECRAVNGDTILGPAINITRTPLNGRTFEYLSEDPLLNSRLVVPIVKGVQAQGVAACVKHFAANNQETNRIRISSQVSERALQEIYLPAFKAAVEEGDAWSVMAAYNRVNGTAAWWAVANLEYQSLNMTWLARWPILIALATHLTVFWEVSYCFLVWNRYTRPLVLWMAVLVHAGIALAMGLMTFGLAMILANMSFLAPATIRRWVDPLAARISLLLVGKQVG